MTLYEIDQELLDLMESVDPETGEWSGDPEAWARLSLERESKIENTACYIKELRGKIITFRDEIRTLQKRQKVLENKEAWLLENLRRSLGGQNFETVRCALKFKANPEAVKITDREAALRWAETYAPDAIRYAEPELNRADLKTILKNGVEVPGCELARETRLEVR